MMLVSLYIMWFVLSLLQACTSSPPGEVPAPATVAEQSPEKSGDKGEEVICPVCGLEFSRSEASKTLDYQGVTYHFLLQDHWDAFKRDPAYYLKKESVAPAPPAEGKAERK
jgi:YHS domain-containing protein